jgi:hypothetical protein
LLGVSQSIGGSSIDISWKIRELSYLLLRETEDNPNKLVSKMVSKIYSKSPDSPAGPHANENTSRN